MDVGIAFDGDFNRRFSLKRGIYPWRIRCRFIALFFLKKSQVLIIVYDPFII